LPQIGSLVIGGDNTPKDDSKLRKLMEQAFSPDEENDTYLHVFIAKNSVQQAIQLIQLCPEKSWLNIRNDLGQTPLHLASYVNSNDIVMLLIHFGASIELTDKDGKNVFHLCAERGHIESFEAIVRMAYQTGQMQTVFQLLNSRDFEGLTPFYRAVSNKHEKMCQSLCQMKVDVNLYDSKSGNSPLHESVVESNVDLDFVEFLVKDCKLDIDAQNYAGASPLHCASARCDMRSYAKLVELGANKNVTDIRGTIPIRYGSTDFQNSVAAL